VLDKARKVSLLILASVRKKERLPVLSADSIPLHANEGHLHDRESASAPRTSRRQARIVFPPMNRSARHGRAEVSVGRPRPALHLEGVFLERLLLSSLYSLEEQLQLFLPPQS